jgi:hypothetical protein
MTTWHEFQNSEIELMANIAYDLNSNMTLTLLPSSTATSMLQTITTTGAYLSLHSATPGTTGASEIAANFANGYTQSARLSITWGSIASGSVASSNGQTYTMGSGWGTASIQYFGIWTAAGTWSGGSVTTPGTYLCGGSITGLTSVPAGANIVFSTGAVTLTING